MAACRLGRTAWKAGQASLRQASTSSSSQGAQSLKWGSKTFGTLGGAGLFAGLFVGGQVFAEDFEIHPPHLPWVHKRYFKSLDHKAIRRGFQVYQQVCAACHALETVYWRELVGVSHTEAEVKAMAAEHLYEDGPNDDGEMFMRPGKLYDPMPKPYKNEKEARAANNGAYPYPLHQIVRGRHGRCDYIFHLLTGYFDPPAGVEMPESMHWNAYFHGNKIAMAKALYPGVMEYEEGDDTPPTVSQMAKDVTVFLQWTSCKYHDDLQKYMTLGGVVVSILFLGAYLSQRRYFSKEFTQQIIYTKMPRRK